MWTYHDVPDEVQNVRRESLIVDAELYVTESSEC